MSSSTADHEVVEIVTDEPSRVHKISVPGNGGDKIWRWAALISVTIATALALAGGLGRLLYVTRSEYTDEARLEAVSRESMRGTLERLDRTLSAQAAAFERLSNDVQAVKVDLAVAKKR